MRVALISIASQPRRAGQAAAVIVAGKTLARRQLDFALAAGCDRIIGIGDGGSPEAIALRHAAEAGNARFQTIRDGHGLLGAIRAIDDVLVIAPGLVAEDIAALDLLASGHSVLVLPSGPGVAAGFERIDLDRAWAGALVLPGGLVERLSDLPAESEPAAALLRIALQARIAERPLQEQALAHGSWSMVGVNDDIARREKDWLRRNLPAPTGRGLSHRLSGLGLRGLGTQLLVVPRAVPGLVAATGVALGGAIAAAAYGLGALGLALVALGALTADFAVGLSRLRAAPFGFRRRRLDLRSLSSWLIDGALTACIVLAIDGAWAHRLFPALVLLAALHASRALRGPGLAAFAGDRAFLAAVFAIASAFGLAEPAVMAAALVILGLEAASHATRRG